MSKLRIEEVIVVEGKYDAVKLADLVDALIVPTKGFSIFSSEETKQLILKLGQKRGIIVLTDSDAAGFRIRNCVNKLATGLCVKNAYVPAIVGKEKRKSQPSKEGLLGVEGVPAEAIVQALRTVGAHEAKARSGRRLRIRICLNWDFQVRREAGKRGVRGLHPSAFHRGFPKKHCVKR